MKIEILLDKLAAPAQRAVVNTGFKTLEELASHTEGEILRLHGIGKNAMAVIRATLDEHGLALRS